ncbi:GNAT family N-acetyltransferase [Streptomyces microflavus]|uniref:GNAT family N-acetyltransferase n=1 Tax=Streptomyces microflavus TaxID=1919 RepID=UPI0035E25D42
MFLIAHVGDKPVGGGDVRLLDEHTAEIKRMYVSGVARAQGIGRYLFEQHAASRRARRIMRETGRRNTAAPLYNRAGYLPCPPTWPDATPESTGPQGPRQQLSAIAAGPPRPAPVAG